MKIQRLYRYSFVLIAIVLAGGVESAKARTFTDATGRKIEGEILSGTKETVSIEISGGKEYTLPISKFSEADQKFIHEWIAANPAPRSYRFDLAETTKRTDRSQEKSGDREITTEKWVYHMKLRSGAPSELTGLEVRYRVFVSSSPEGDTKERPVSTVDGGFKIETMRPNAEQEFTSKTFTLTESEATGAARYEKGGRKKMKDEIEGIWVKVFQDGARVWETKVLEDTAGKAEWPDEEALKVAAD